MDNFTAHIREKNGIEEEQSVYLHCIGTAERAGIYARAIGTETIAALQGRLHDIGKLCKDFDDYIHNRNDMCRGEIDHCYAGAKYLYEYARNKKNKEWVETAAFIARTIISHHGLHDWLDEEGESYFDRRIKKDERYEEISSHIGEVISEEEMETMLAQAAKEYFRIKSTIKELSDKKRIHYAFYMGMFERLMESVLMSADCTDTANYQLDRETEAFFGDEIWQKFYDNIEEKSRRFREKQDFLSDIRNDISQRCQEFANHQVGICRLIVPTGGGKTISSLRFAIHYCKNFGKRRIFYIAPYMSILEQNSDVWKEVMGEEYVLEHHSNMIADIEDQEELAEYELRSDQWDMPVIATTMVQFLNTLFSRKKDSVKRMHRLCNAVIILDEVQSVPAKCVSLFNLAMNFLSAVGRSSIVLCSATQPTFEKTKYPIRVDAYASMTGDYSPDFQALKRTEVISAVRREGYTYEEAASFCLEKFEEAGSVLFVVNTKGAAFRIYQILQEETRNEMSVFHISTNMCPENRRNIISQLRDGLRRNEKIICVTTQLIEAGVDISFPCVIRSLAGIDNVAQAAGRCNRNGEYAECSNVFLINLSEEKLGSLREIKAAQSISMQMLGNKKYADLLAVDTMSDYFQKLYAEKADELEYNVSDSGMETDIVHLLSTVPSRWEQKNHREPFSIRVQAFETAGHLFEVIENKNTISVIVPYNEEARMIISRLREDVEYGDIITLLRKAQKYTVEIYEDKKRLLESCHGIELLPCGAVVLQEAYYSECLGVLFEGRPMDLLLF